MKKINDILFNKMQGLSNIIWKANFVVILLVILSSAFLYPVFQKLDANTRKMIANKLAEPGMSEAVIPYVPSAFVFLVIMIPVLILIICVHIMKIKSGSLPVLGYIISGIIGLYSSYRIISAIDLNSAVKKEMFYAAFLCLTFVMFEGLCSLMAILFKYVFCSSYTGIKLIESVIISAVLSFVVIIFIPAQSFFYNFTDYSFPYFIILKATIVDFVFWTVAGSLILPLFKKNCYYGIIYGLTGMLVALYVQYMFMNLNIGTIDGTSFDWKTNMGMALFNTLIWLVLILGPFIAGLIKKKTLRKIFVFITGFIGLIHIGTYVTMLVQADESCYKYSAIYFTYEDQYKLATDNNVILFIVDAVDNQMVKELYEDRPEVFAEYKDFSMYTDTCSVYDNTSYSMLQMFTNTEFDNTHNGTDLRNIAWNCPQANEFYKRLHDNNYIVNCYNLQYETSPGVVGKIDNAHLFDEKKDTVKYIGYKHIRQTVNKLAMYTLLPDMLKQTVDVEKISFEDCIVFTDNSCYYENDEFKAHLNLEPGDMENAVIYQHIYGAHAPNDNVDGVQHCFEILTDYTNQMKELGVYDKATIIITSDHGVHDYSDSSGTGMKAATPLFMVKQAEEHHDTMQLNAAPEYHTDIIPTILSSLKLYNEGDEELFGKPVFDYNENDKRTRIWYDRVRDKDYPMTGSWNTYYGYEYTGDTAEFERVVEAGENLTIYPMPLMHN